ncbi:MAG TPA: EamA family transporter [Anaerolineae bacterium]|nr:EamA family transporter [Anaerolineae bacterium]HPL27882.1 EamA family transporter [Anaerolineae bacterium]
MAGHNTPGAAVERRAGLDLGLLAVVLVTVITWGSAFAGIRMALEFYTPAHLALLRYLIASLALGVYAAFARMRLPRLRDLPGLALIGFVGIAFYNLALIYGETTIPAGTASLLIASTPVWMALFAALIFSERLRPLGWLGIAVSFAGATVIALGSGSGLGLDPQALIVLAAALASAAYSLGQKPFLARYSALECTAYAIWAGTLALLPFAPGLWAKVRAAPPTATLAVAYLGVVPAALGYVLWARILARVPAATAGSFLYLVPASAMLVAWVWLGEAPGPLALAGGALIIAGVILVNRWGRQSPAQR